MKNNILLVDDDDFIRFSVGESLASLGYRVELANDGVEAWQKLVAKPEGYDLVLLDKNMPRMHGIALLRQMKSDNRFAELPAIMLTGANQTQDVVEGLAVGAYYYLIKPVEQEVLSRVVGNALQEVESRRELHAQLGQHKSNLCMLQRAEFVFHTLQEARDLALLLADSSMDPKRTLNGYAELLVNAVEHGNLEIGYQQKGLLLGEGLWMGEIERRLSMPQYSIRHVEVLLERKPGVLQVTISDQGRGFEWQKFLDFDPERAFDLHGRGIAMSRGLSFDGLEYVGCGNKVVTKVKF